MLTWPDQGQTGWNADCGLRIVKCVRRQDLKELTGASAQLKKRTRYSLCVHPLFLSRIGNATEFAAED